MKTLFTGEEREALHEARTVRISRDELKGKKGWRGALYRRIERDKRVKEIHVKQGWLGRSTFGPHVFLTVPKELSPKAKGALKACKVYYAAPSRGHAGTLPFLAVRLGSSLWYLSDQDDPDRGTHSKPAWPLGRKLT
jgi:hypothetical protein